MAAAPRVRRPRWPERDWRDLTPARVCDPGRCAPAHRSRNPPGADRPAEYRAPMDAHERADASDRSGDWLGLPGRLRADLTRAMLDRDQTAVSVLRTTLAAIANAEAPPLTDPPPAPVVGRLVEHRRLELSGADLERIVRDEIADRRDTVARYTHAGRERAGRRHAGRDHPPRALPRLIRHSCASGGIRHGCSRSDASGTPRVWMRCHRDHLLRDAWRSDRRQAITGSACPWRRARDRRRPRRAGAPACRDPCLR